MEWLTYSDAKLLTQALRTDRCLSQVISVAADTNALLTHMPTKPRLVLPEEGPPAAMNEWYGRIGNRLVTIQCEARGAIKPGSVCIFTGFLEVQDKVGDWAVLLELGDLPQAIYVRRPLFIESRCTKSSFVVFRPDTQGWKTAIYRAASEADAKNLLTFIGTDDWNKTCFIGSPEPVGKWVIEQCEQLISGVSPELSSALRFACEMSLQANVELLVKDASGINSKIYVISKGNVTKESEGVKREKGTA